MIEEHIPEFLPTRKKNAIHLLVSQVISVFTSQSDLNTRYQLITAQSGLAAMGQSESECVCVCVYEPEAGRVRELFIEFPVTYYYLSCLLLSRSLSISIHLIPPTLQRFLIQGMGE